MNNTYLINKASGGLAHMLGGIYAALILAKKNNRFLIIDCKTHHAFRHKFSDFFILKRIFLMENNEELMRRRNGNEQEEFFYEYARSSTRGRL